MSNRLHELLDGMDMPYSTGPVWEEESDRSDEEPGSFLVDDADSCIAERCGHLVLTTWGDIYELPRTLWKGRGCCSWLIVSTRFLNAQCGEVPNV